MVWPHRILGGEHRHVAGQMHGSRRPRCITLAVACRTHNETRPYVDPPPPGVEPTRIDYVENDSFDELFEAALTNQDPAILIQTTTAKPEWGGRLNAWIAAWNQGGPVSGLPPRGPSAASCRA